MYVIVDIFSDLYLQIFSWKPFENLQDIDLWVYHQFCFLVRSVMSNQVQICSNCSNLKGIFVIDIFLRSYIDSSWYLIKLILFAWHFFHLFWWIIPEIRIRGLLIYKLSSIFECYSLLNLLILNCLICSQ